MKNVILVSDKNNEVHEMFGDMLTCNHIPLDNDEYEEVSNESISCHRCLSMIETYKEMAEIISKEEDERILDMFRTETD